MSFEVDWDYYEEQGMWNRPAGIFFMFLFLMIENLESGELNSWVMKMGNKLV